MKTQAISGLTVAERLNTAFPGVVMTSDEQSVTVAADRVVEVTRFLRDDEELDAKFLNTLLGIDWQDHFEMVYVVSSLAKNHTMVLKAWIANHQMPIIASVTGVWLAANLQEREVYDLMGIGFTDHPNLNRIFLWEGFPGHPLRKDFLALPGGYKPGLQRFPFEFPAGQRDYPALRQGDTQSPPAVPQLSSRSAAATAAEGISGGQLGTMGGGARGARSRDDDSGGTTDALAEGGHSSPDAGGRSGESL